MNEVKVYPFLYFANLAFIATNIYGWILKEFHTAKPYKEHFDILFPAQRLVGLLYLAQLMEIPYLLMIGQPKALFYINAFSALFFPAMMVVIGEGYFFWRKYKTKQLIFHFLPIYISVGWLLLAALDIVPATPCLYRWMFGVICLLFLYYIIRIAVVQKKILSKTRETIEGNNTTDDSFPIPLSLRTRWLLFPIPLLMFGCFLCNNVHVKMGRDILFTLVNVWFLFYTIKPHRSIGKNDLINNVLHEKEAPVDPPKRIPKYKLTPERCLDLEQQITEKLENEELFRNPALTIESLAVLLDSNKSYVSEAISRGRFGSYYAMINHFRIEYAIMLLKEDPKQKIEHVSKVSGFSSISLFSQVFKRSKGVSPTLFVQEILANTKSE